MRNAALPQAIIISPHSAIRNPQSAIMFAEAVFPNVLLDASLINNASSHGVHRAGPDRFLHHDAP